MICREIGVADNYLISADEYRTHLMLPMRHWHQMADALAWEAGAVCSETKVNINATALDSAITEIAHSISEGELHAWFTMSRSFSKLSFCDILEIRSNQAFYENLLRLDDAVGKDNSEFLKTFEEHWRVILNTLRWKFLRPERTQIHDLLAETEKAISPEPLVQSILVALRFVLSLGPNFLSTLQREGELRWFVRRVRETPTSVPHK